MFYNSAAGTYKGVNCETNNYGAASTTFGLAAFPCRACPAGMQTSVALPSSAQFWATDNAATPSQGFISPLACVSKGGWGYSSGVASRCPVGSFNPAGNWSPCTKCPVGLSTPDNATQQVSIQNCAVAAGYGFADGILQPCPVGTYNDVLRSTNNAACTACGTGMTTSQPGGTSAADCDVCLAGYGGSPCGACGGASATFGPAGQQNKDACSACPSMATGFSFTFAGANQPFTPASVARSLADSAGDCLAEFAQIEDLAWYLGGTASLTNVTTVSDFAGCVTNCKGDDSCQYITFNCAAAPGSQCSKKVSVKGSAVVAFKAVVAGDSTAASLRKRKSAAAKGLSSGSYTFWNENADAAASIGVQNTAAAATVQACLDACDADNACAGVAMTGLVARATTSSATGTCKLVRADATVATFRRSVTKAVVSRLSLDVGADEAAVRVYVADKNNYRTKRFNATGSFTLFWQSDGDRMMPYDVAVDSATGSVFVSYPWANRIQKYNASGSLLLSWGSQGTGNGQFNGPRGLAVDAAGNVFVADTDNNRVQKYNGASGAFLMQWGGQGSGNGQFSSCHSVAIDSAGSVYVSDPGNYRVQKFDAAGGFLTAWGGFTGPYSTGPGSNGKFNQPMGIAVDSKNSVYVADMSNSCIQKFTSAGAFLKRWGVDGGADGEFHWPIGVAVDSSDNVYVADTYMNRVQRFDSNGTLIGKWGSAGLGDTDLTGLFLKEPSGIAVYSP